MNNYLDEAAINKLNEEIEHRKVVIRKKINEDLKEAKSHGDLSENFEYKAAKRDRAINESRIRYLERMIKTAILIEDTTENNEVGIGKNVIIRFLEEDETEEYKIVTTVEADPLENRVSIESPIGKAIYKKRIGDIVKVESPSGEYEIIIEDIKLI